MDSCPSPTALDQKSSRRKVTRSCVEDYRRLPSVLVLCGILSLVYVVISTISFLSWLPSSHPYDHVEHALDFMKNSSFEPVQVDWETISSSQPPPFAIFYNVYIPVDQGEEGVKKALEIVKEQMDFIGNSYAASYDGGKPVTVFYKTIGKHGALNTTYMHHVCSERNKFVCHHMQHHHEGFEELTLQSLYEYCQHQGGSDTRVVYMHNKGSFHSREGQNRRWRSHMMMAVTSELCLKPPDDSCNVCGLMFYDVWALIFPGNFWTAKCSYIQKLIPPNRFNSSMTRMFDLRKQKIEENPIFASITPNIKRLDKYGTGRYASEQWVGSSPGLIPCDLTGDKALDDWRMVDRTPHDLTWNMLPRPHQAPGQYLMLLGNLFKWFTLYNAAPSDDSYAWRVSPDGEKWKRAVKLYGNRTVDLMVETERKRQLASLSGMSSHPA